MPAVWGLASMSEYTGRDMVPSLLLSSLQMTLLAALADAELLQTNREVPTAGQLVLANCGTQTLSPPGVPAPT